MLNYDFKDKVVLITGAGSGIGEECAKEFSKAGATVVLCDNKEERIRKVKEEITNNGGKALGCKVDVTDYHMIEKLIDFTVEKLGKIDVVVNSAGICKLMPIDEMAIETVDALIDINLKGTVYMCKALTPVMKKQNGGKIINMASIAGRICNSGFNVYATTKAGIMAITSSMARELAPYNVNVNSVLPGIVRTNMWEGILDDLTKKDDSIREETFKQSTSAIPLGRPQTVEDIANMVLYLASDTAKNITAQNIAVDGGYTFDLQVLEIVSFFSLDYFY